MHRSQQVLIKTCRVVLVKLRHLLGLDNLLLLFLLVLLENFVEARICWHQLALEVELKLNIGTVVFLDQLMQVKGVKCTLV